VSPFLRKKMNMTLLEDSEGDETVLTQTIEVERLDSANPTQILADPFL